MQGRCDKHLFESAEDTCGTCGYEFCGECLVYAFGPKKPPFCIPCAVAAAGIRSSAANRPMMDGRELKQLRKERRSALRRARKQQALPEPELEGSPLLSTPEPRLDGTGLLDAALMQAPSPVLPAKY